MRVDTVVEATGRRSRSRSSFGWHPYWRLPGARDDWAVQLPDVAHARLDRRGIPTGRARVEPAGRPAAARARELDDLYAFAGDRTADAPRRRPAAPRSRSTPATRSSRCTRPTRGPFCCIEPMTAPTNALVTGDHPTVRPGATFTASFTATVRTAR